MRSRLSFVLPLIFVAIPVTAGGADITIPAGALLQCTLGEPNFSSKTAAVGDPVLCQVRFGGAALPYGSYLVGRFAEFRDPGHFIGKGWMRIDFDRLTFRDHSVPLSAKIINVPDWPVDRKGRIHGRGHAVRDIVGWSIPLLWPVKVITLPMRGPRPRLTNETSITLKVMDDVVVPEGTGLFQPSPLRPRQYRPSSGVALPDLSNSRFASSRTAMETSPVRNVQATGVTPVEPVTKAKESTLLMLKDGKGHLATDYWFESSERIRFTSVDGTSGSIPIEDWDPAMTIELNKQRGVTFAIRSAKIEGEN